MIPPAQPPQAGRAAGILHRYWGQITRPGNRAVPALPPAVFRVTGRWGDQGFAYGPEGPALVIEAAQEQSFVHGVYDYLERVEGCRFWTSSAERIPRKDRIRLDFPPHSFVPPLTYRQVEYLDLKDGAFSEKHKLAPARVHEGWGNWSHSFKDLVPNRVHFEAHPDWFALIDGRRHPDGQPCLAHPEVKRTVIANLRQAVEAHPEARWWSVAQNDDALYCRCPACAALDEREGSPMASVLTFVNAVAAEFPDKNISTLAYWYTRKPPRTVRPGPNVHILTCNIEAGRGLPIPDDPTAEGTRQELEAWGRIGGQVFLWDYNIQFRNLVSPFPNLRTLAPNLRYFASRRVTALFSQGNREIGGEFHELRAYLLAKLAWDPACDLRFHLEDFCRGYYGPAGPFVLEYIDRLHDAQEASGKRLDIFGGPEEARETYLAPGLFAGYEELFDRAEAAVSGDGVLGRRVRTARLPLLYAGAVLGYGTDQERKSRIDRFETIAREGGLVMVEEWKITVGQWLQEMREKG